jgi:hypothetical protein
MWGRREKNGQNGVGGLHGATCQVIFSVPVTIGIVGKFWDGNNAIKSVLLTETFSMESSGAQGRNRTTDTGIFSSHLMHFLSIGYASLNKESTRETPVYKS